MSRPQRLQIRISSSARVQRGNGREGRAGEGGNGRSCWIMFPEYFERIDDGHDSRFSLRLPSRFFHMKDVAPIWGSGSSPGRIAPGTLWRGFFGPRLAFELVKRQGVMAPWLARLAEDQAAHSAASCHKTYFGEVHRPPVSYFSMNAGAVGFMARPSACHRCFPASIP
jgi:hypothetical protein